MILFRLVMVGLVSIFLVVFFVGVEGKGLLLSLVDEVGMEICCCGCLLFGEGVVVNWEVESLFCLGGGGGGGEEWV